MDADILHSFKVLTSTILIYAVGTKYGLSHDIHISIFCRAVGTKYDLSYDVHTPTMSYHTVP